MKSKQEVIQEAYGEHWPKVEKDIIQECYICLINERSTLVPWNGILMISHKTDNHLYMPASLKGIETNNGWTRIEGEADLPKVDGDYFVVWKVGDDVQVSAVSYDVDQPEYWHGVTHYQAVIKPLPPIY
ncbi:hypothetical protein K7A41_09505 [Sphingobacterium sp. InxBP1]|uniref:hypothetical protein n=1 Tax=Sphingobacterium sp. InxBP1 TaxID=2870328 RepID=UPI002242E1BE|nr:hypothetical protein [Sphingobacterium sp. InxBP1]MCW8311458.1 hypothetical protein [Sphingobacterium sp. InxBP1]